MSVSFLGLPCTGRVEIKKNLLPSEVMNGSASLYRPENGVTSGGPHLPPAYCETIIVQWLNDGEFFMK
jgi:hypothetical protein